MILKQGDCLDLMKDIPDKSVDMVLCDLPYGHTKNKWDNVIGFEMLWKQYKRIITDHGCIVLFGFEPFSSLLRTSNLKMYRYDWIWKKGNTKGRFLSARKMPLRNHEDILVFYKHLPTYHPQMTRGKPYSCSSRDISSSNYSKGIAPAIRNKGTRYPIDIINFSPGDTRKRIHPTQKPIELLKYLIHTYTNEGDTVLDNTMGSGSTGVACVDTHRDFIGYELDEHYFNVARQRIKEAENSLA